MSNIHAEAQLVRKLVIFIQRLNGYLNHFPKSEKYALANRIRNTAYEVFDLVVEGEKRYTKKTTLSSLDIAHERLRMQLFLAFELGRALKRGDVDTVVSILGHAKGTASMPHLAKTIRESDNGKNLPLSKRVRRLYNL